MKAEIVIDMRAEREAYKIDMEAERHNAKISVLEERRIMWAQRYGNDSGFDPDVTSEQEQRFDSEAHAAWIADKSAEDATWLAKMRTA